MCGKTVQTVLFDGFRVQLSVSREFLKTVYNIRHNFINLICVQKTTCPIRFVFVCGSQYGGLVDVPRHAARPVGRQPSWVVWWLRWSSATRQGWCFTEIVSICHPLKKPVSIYIFLSSIHIYFSPNCILINWKRLLSLRKTASPRNISNCPKKVQKKDRMRRGDSLSHLVCLCPPVGFLLLFFLAAVFGILLIAGLIYLLVFCTCITVSKSFFLLFIYLFSFLNIY